MSVSETAEEASPAKKAKTTEEPKEVDVFVDEDNNVILTDTRGHQLVEYQAPANLEAGRTSSLASANMHLSGHKGAVYSCAFDPSGQTLASAGMDKNILLWDVFGKECNNFNVLRGHKNAVLEMHYLPKSTTLVREYRGYVVCCMFRTLGGYFSIMLLSYSITTIHTRKP